MLLHTRCGNVGAAHAASMRVNKGRVLAALQRNRAARASTERKRARLRSLRSSFLAFLHRRAAVAVVGMGIMLVLD